MSKTVTWLLHGGVDLDTTSLFFPSLLTPQSIRQTEEPIGLLLGTRLINSCETLLLTAAEH